MHSHKKNGGRKTIYDSFCLPIYVFGPLKRCGCIKNTLSHPAKLFDKTILHCWKSGKTFRAHLVGEFLLGKAQNGKKIYSLISNKYFYKCTRDKLIIMQS